MKTDINSQHKSFIFDITGNRKLLTALKQREKSIMTVFEEHYTNDSVWPRTEEGKVPKAKSLNAVTHLVPGYRKERRSNS